MESATPHALKPHNSQPGRPPWLAIVIVAMALPGVRVEAQCRCGDTNSDGIWDGRDIQGFADSIINLDDILRVLCADMDGNAVVDEDDVTEFVNNVLLLKTSPTCPSFDAWETPFSGPGSTTPSSYAFGGAGDQPPIPAGFFGPGSDPFIGTVLLDGLPLDPSKYAGTDTVVRRPPMLPPPIPPGFVAPIELVQLSLVSVNPISVTYGGIGNEPWNVNTAISDTPSLGGTMTVNEVAPGFGGTFSATLPVRPVFLFTNANDLQQLDAGFITPDQVRVQVMDTGDPGSPPNPLQIQFGPGGPSPWIRQACSPGLLQDGLFWFRNNDGLHNHDAGFIPGVQGGQNDPCNEQFKPGPMRHVKPGESHYIKPPNKNPGGIVPPRCGYNFIGQRTFCRAGKIGVCPAPRPVLCTRICGPGTPPCPLFIVRIVKIRCRNAVGVANRGWCFQFYRLRLPPLDCAVCP